MDIIPIQASSVPCERVFSSGKETMAPQRRRISPKLMESLQMMKYSIRKGRPLNFTQGMQWNDELIEFEFAARMAPVGDAEAYGHSLREEEKDEDVDVDEDAMEDDLDDLEKDLEALEQQLMDEEDEEDEEDDSAFDDYE
jgi:hypothetical protein